MFFGEIMPKYLWGPVVIGINLACVYRQWNRCTSLPETSTLDQLYCKQYEHQSVCWTKNLRTPDYLVSAAVLCNISVSVYYHVNCTVCCVCDEWQACEIRSQCCFNYGCCRRRRRCGSYILYETNL